MIEISDQNIWGNADVEQGLLTADNFNAAVRSIAYWIPHLMKVKYSTTPGCVFWVSDL